MKITEEIKKDILEKRNLGFSYARIAKETKVSRSTVIKVLKEDRTLEVKVLKQCPNPRIIFIYFDGDKSNFAKCVVRPGSNHPANKTLLVKKIETSNEPLYRIV
jgi:intein-encoded DNA endonuclease-like protein